MENNNANSQQPSAQPTTLVAPKEPTFCESAWAATQVVAAASAAEFTIGLAKAAGVTLGACLIPKAFGVFDGKSES